MKANGLNYKMFRYSTHDYMDMQPEVSFATWQSKEKAMEAIKEFRNTWNSGTVSDPVEITPMQFFLARQSNYWKGYEDRLDTMAQDCTEEWLDEYSFYVEHKDWDTAVLRYQWSYREVGLSL